MQNTFKKREMCEDLQLENEDSIFTCDCDYESFG